MKRAHGNTNLLAAAVLIAATAISVAACSKKTDDDPSAEADVGTVGLALTLSPGVTVDSATYSISGPGGFSKTGTINVSHSSTISATIPGLPPGSGFTISIGATSTNGATACSGSAMFNVAAHTTSTATVHLICQEAPRTGSVSVTGTVNVCPVVDGVSANPSDVTVGSTIALLVSAHDSDAGPAALSYSWTASSGTLSSSTGPNPTFTCGMPGTATITVTASDGDATAGCPNASSVQVHCSLPGAGGPATPLTVAVYGDAPYGATVTDTSQTLATPAFIASVNADPNVSLVIHVGDIHSGKQFCTQAYDQTIFDLWGAYQDPLVYIPGDNEWSDCHKAAQGGGTYNTMTGMIDYVRDGMGNLVDYAGGDPIANLALVRSIFYPTPGLSLGVNKRQVLSQAQSFDPAHATDGAFVENVMWEQSHVLFVTVNIPGGSNNDADIWYGAPTASPAQTQEIADRTGAVLRWIDTAFAQAQADGVVAVVIVSQADMWDPEKGAAHQAGYEPFVQSIATHTTAFAKPVLMFNGDSHVYQTGNPYNPADPNYAMHPGYNVTNIHRVVVHGSTLPLEWLRLTIDPAANAPESPTAFGPFSWERMIQP